MLELSTADILTILDRPSEHGDDAALSALLTYLFAFWDGPGYWHHPTIEVKQNNNGGYICFVQFDRDSTDNEPLNLEQIANQMQSLIYEGNALFSHVNVISTVRHSVTAEPSPVPADP